MKHLSICNLERKVRHENQSLRNHILSIYNDSTIVDILQNYFPFLPLYANLRNGFWYSKKFTGQCYFKSTDGHYNHEKFSLTRLNLDVALAASENHGIVIIDSTRRGKKYPDSMTATIPIWCAVINCIIFENGQNFQKYYYPPEWISSSHSDDICLKMQYFINNELSNEYKLMIQSKLNPSVMRFPLRPVWCCPTQDNMIDWSASQLLTSSSSSKLHQHDSDYIKVDDSRKYTSNTTNIDPFNLQNHNNCNNEESSQSFLEILLDDYKSLPYLPVVLVSVSVCLNEESRIKWREEHSWTYIQGAGDDHVS